MFNIDHGIGAEFSGELLKHSVVADFGEAVAEDVVIAGIGAVGIAAPEGDDPEEIVTCIVALEFGHHLAAVGQKFFLFRPLNLNVSGGASGQRGGEDHYHKIAHK